MALYCSQGHENPDGSMFCDTCGEQLSPAAASAGAAGMSAPMGPADTPAGAPMGTPAGTPGVGMADAGHPRLVVEADNAVFDLSGKTEVIIGREDPVSNVYPDVDLTPHRGEEDGVSRMHAKLLIHGGQYLIEDENSTNFTFVNKQKLAPKVPTPIKDGDEIRLGRVVMRFYAS